MRSTAESLAGNKVKLSVELDEAEMAGALDEAFRRVAQEVRVPGFRPGKVPRRLLEAKVGAGTLRQEALRSALPAFYAQAVRESDIDVISQPEIDITGGEESGPVTFDAVVEVRPEVSIAGYQGLAVTLPAFEVTDADVDSQVDLVRGQFATLAEVARPARDGDQVSIDLKGTRHGEVVGGLDLVDYMYEVGSGSVVEGLDEQLRGGRAGDILKFNAEGLDGEATVQVLVKQVQVKVLPELTDKWVAEALDVDSVNRLRDEVRSALVQRRLAAARSAMRDGALQALVELVQDDPPESLVADETERRLHSLEHQLGAQGASLEDYFAAAGRPQSAVLADLRALSRQAVKADLALRALAAVESIDPSDEELDGRIAAMAAEAKVSPAKLRQSLERSDALGAVRSDLRKQEALRWLFDHVELVDELGRPVDRQTLFPAAAPGEPPAAHDEEGADDADGEDTSTGEDSGAGTGER